MKRIILICIIVAIVSGCKHTSDSQSAVQNATDDQTIQSESIIQEIVLKNGRKCQYFKITPHNANQEEYVQKVTAYYDMVLGKPKVVSEEVSDDEYTEEDSHEVIMDGEECEEHKDCLQGSACLTVIYNDYGDSHSVCQNMVNLSCTTDLDCPEYENCYQGKCAICHKDIDCRYGYSCEKGACVPKNRSPLCTDTSQCGRGEICIFGECSAFCKNSDDCPDGMICQRDNAIDGVCIRVHPEKYSSMELMSCLSNKDEASYEICKIDEPNPSNKPINNADECVGDLDCESGRNKDRCLVSEKICVECLENSDCKGDKPVCSHDHTCEECTSSNDCAGNLRCGVPPHKENSMNFHPESSERLHCIECARDSDCGSEKPYCDNGTCVSVECMKNTDCCFMEICQNHSCIKLPKAYDRSSDPFYMQHNYDDHSIKEGFFVEDMHGDEYQSNDIIEESRTAFIEEYDYYICQEHTDCGYNGDPDEDPNSYDSTYDHASWCSPIYHQCVEIHPKYSNYYLVDENTMHGFVKAPFLYSHNMFEFCWHDSQCPDGQVCNEYGRCGCTPDSCGAGMECSVKFGCLCTNDNACGALVCQNHRCTCTEDKQCGKNKLCSSDGSCFASNDKNALYNEGLTWYVEYHKRPRDLKKAKHFLTKAASLGHAKAMILLAAIYFEQNQDKKGIQTLEKASNLKIAEAMYKLAMYYQNHSEISHSENLALKYLKKSADLYYRPSLLLLAQMYAKGQGVEKDIDKSLKYLKMYYVFRPGSEPRDPRDDEKVTLLMHELSESSDITDE